MPTNAPNERLLACKGWFNDILCYIMAFLPEFWLPASDGFKVSVKAVELQ